MGDDSLKALQGRVLKKISRSTRAYVNLVLTSQVQARLSMVGNSGLAVDSQQVFKSAFNALISNEDYSIAIDISQYQGVLEYALSMVDFSGGIGIYTLPNNLNLIIGKKKGCNNKV